MTDSKVSSWAKLHHPRLFQQHISSRTYFELFKDTSLVFKLIRSLSVSSSISSSSTSSAYSRSSDETT